MCTHPNNFNHAIALDFTNQGANFGGANIEAHNNLGLAASHIGVLLASQLLGIMTTRLRYDTSTVRAARSCCRRYRKTGGNRFNCEATSPLPMRSTKASGSTRQWEIPDSSTVQDTRRKMPAMGDDA